MSKFTDFLNLFKWDTKSAVDLEEYYDIDTAVNDNWDKIEENAIKVDERLNKLENNGITTNNYARALKGTVQDKEFAQVYADSPNIEELEIKGQEITQKVREGYNILYMDNINKNGTINGIEYKFNGNEFTLNGTATQDTDIYAFGSWTTTTVNEKRNLVAGDYTLAIIGNSNNNRFAVNMYNNEKLVISAYKTNLATKTLTEDKGIANLYLSISNGATFTNETFKIMLLKGKYTADTLPKYEKYGVSPSIDYLSEIENVVNRIAVNITGKNYIGYNENSTITKYGLTINYSNGIFTINGTVNRDSYLNLTDILSLNIYTEEKDVLPRRLCKNKYNLEYNFLGGTKSTSNTNLALVNKVETPDIKFYLNGCHLEDKNLVVNITDSLDYYMYLWIKNGTIFTDFKFAMQLEVGENVTEIEPYKDKVFNVTLPENCFLGEFKGYKNYIKKNKLYNNLKIITLTGQENWGYSAPAYNLAKTDIPNINASYNSTNLMCNYFKVNTGTTAVGEMRVGTNYLLFNYDNGVGGVEVWKAFLQEKYNAGTPVVVLYVTNTEEEVELPAETQTLLSNFELYEDLNNIGVESGTISFKYNKSLAREFEKIYNLIGTTNTTGSEVLDNG